MSRSKVSAAVLGTVAMATSLASALPPPLPAPRAPRTPQVEPSLARMDFKTTTHELGEIFDHEKREFSFEFTNSGAEKLVITEVKSSCGCTAGALAKKEYEPGESGTIDVTFDPKGKRGDQHRNLRIRTNDSSNQEIMLTVKAHVTELVAVDPGVVSFSSAIKGQGAKMYVTVTGRTPDFEVTRATPGKLESFGVEVLGTEVVDELDRQGKPTGAKLRQSTIEVTLKDSAKVGRLDDRLSIRTNDERRPLVTAQVIARVLGDLAVTPTRIALGRPELGATFEREFTVASRTGTPFKIKEVKFADGPVKMRFEVTPVNANKPDTYTIKMSATAARVHPRLRQDIVIITDVPGEEEISVPVSGVITTRG